MIDRVRSWLSDNQTLVYFLAAQASVLGAAAISIIAYSVRLETRVSTLEVRGSPPLAAIENRLTALENQTESNKESIGRIVDKLTK